MRQYVSHLDCRAARPSAAAAGGPQTDKTGAKQDYGYGLRNRVGWIDGNICGDVAGIASCTDVGGEVIAERIRDEIVDADAAGIGDRKVERACEHIACARAAARTVDTVGERSVWGIGLILPGKREHRSGRTGERDLVRRRNAEIKNERVVRSAGRYEIRSSSERDDDADLVRTDLRQRDGPECPAADVGFRYHIEVRNYGRVCGPEESH